MANPTSVSMQEINDTIHLVVDYQKRFIKNSIIDMIETLNSESTNSIEADYVVELGLICLSNKDNNNSRTFGSRVSCSVNSSIDYVYNMVVDELKRANRAMVGYTVVLDSIKINIKDEDNIFDYDIFCAIHPEFYEKLDFVLNNLNEKELNEFPIMSFKANY